MAYDVSSLTDYVDEQNFPLLRKTVLGAKTASLVELQTGVKSETALNRLETTITFQDDGCSRSASGDDTITQRNIKVGEIAVHKDFCPKDLEKKALQTQVKAGSVQDEIPFEQQFAENIARNIAKTLEIAIWQGDLASGDANLNKFDGFIKIIDTASASTVDGNVDAVSASVGITKANIESIVDGMYESIPADVVAEDDMALFMGVDNFRVYTQALKDSNLFHYDAENSDWEITIPGTNVRIYGVHGLNGTDRMFASQRSNMYVGVDLEDEEEDFEMWYSKDDRVVKFTSAFKYGVQVAFPDQIVEFTLVP